MKITLFLSIILLISIPMMNAQVTINEIRIDQPAADDDEYFELVGTPSDDLSGLTYLVIGDGSGGSGTIEAVVDLTGQIIPLSGYFVAAESTFTLSTANFTTILNFENSDNTTHLLVEGFTGTNGDDLDTDDDGVLDVIPWTSVYDALSIIETVGSGDLYYALSLGGAEIGPDGTNVPTHVSRCPDLGDWLIGVYEVGLDDSPGTTNICTTPTPGPTDTPGPSNTPGPTDTPLPATETPTATPTGPTPTPFPVEAIKINEININPTGADIACYVELYFEGGSPLDGYTLVGVNGFNGSDYQSIDLAGYAIGFDGYFVIAQDADVANADLIDSKVNYQNGPDSIQLRYGEQIVDAVAYGDFSSGAIFAGEGNPTDSYFTDASHSRLPDGMDTDDNAMDFFCGLLTPGETNMACPDPTATPTAEPATPTPNPTDTPVATETPTPEPTATPSGEPCVHHGDCNLDGEITAGDAQYCFEITLGLETPTAEEACAADCNADDTVTAGDAQTIFFVVLGSANCVDPL